MIWLPRWFLLLLACAANAAAARLEVLDVPGATLRGNPLGDPAQRRVAIVTPDDAKANAAKALVIYLPGWGGSSEDAISGGSSSWFAGAVEELARAGIRVRLAVVDGRSRYGGSQFLNSSATGRYADYVADEILPLLKPEPAQRSIIAGHSSGAYGALLLASSRRELFHAVVALSPDSDFEVTHKPLVQQPAIRAVKPDDLEAAVAPVGKARLPEDGMARLVLGLCANYAPSEGKPGRFEWLYDARGEWRQDVWQRWLDLDPLTLVKRRKDAFTPEQRIYLDGAEHDEFGANIGARKIHEVLRERKSAVTFSESPGHHSDHLQKRLVRGVKWVLEKR